MLLLNLGNRLATVIRLAGLAVISWTIVHGEPAPGTTGRRLLITVLFAAAVVTALALLAHASTSCEMADPSGRVVQLEATSALLVVSEATVKTHVNHVYAKIGARDRAQAVHYAYTHDLAS